MRGCRRLAKSCWRHHALRARGWTRPALREDACQEIWAHSRVTSATESHSLRKRVTISSRTLSPGRSDAGPDMKNTSALSRRLGSLRYHARRRRRNKRSCSFSKTMPDGAIVMSSRSPLAKRMTAEDRGLCRTSLFTNKRWVHPADKSTQAGSRHGGSSPCGICSTLLASFIASITVISGCSDSGTRLSVVGFDASRRPIPTFFASAPHGSHQQLMEAPQAIKNCAQYGGARKE